MTIRLAQDPFSVSEFSARAASRGFVGNDPPSERERESEGSQHSISNGLICGLARPPKGGSLCVVKSLNYRHIHRGGVEEVRGRNWVISVTPRDLAFVLWLQLHFASLRLRTSCSSRLGPEVAHTRNIAYTLGV